MRRRVGGLLIGALAGVGASFGPTAVMVALAALVLAWRVLGRIAVPTLAAGFGVVVTVVALPGMTNSDPAVSYPVTTVATFVAGLGALAIGLVLLGRDLGQRRRAGTH